MGTSIAAMLFLVMSIAASAIILRQTFRPQAQAVLTASPTREPVVITSAGNETQAPERTTAPATAGPYAEIHIQLAPLPSGDASLSEPLEESIREALADSPLRYATAIEIGAISSLPAASDLAETDLLIAWEAEEDELIKIYLIAASPPPMLQVASDPVTWNATSAERLPIYATEDQLAFAGQAAAALLELREGDANAVQTSMERMRLVQSALPAPYGASQQTLLTFIQGLLAMPGRDVLALQAFSDNLRQDVDFAAAYVNRGNTYLKLGDPVSALRDYERALQLEPERIDVMYNEAVAYDQLGDASSTDLAVLEITRLLPDAAWVVNLQGTAYYRQSEWEQAAAAFERAHALAPKEEIPLFNLAQTRYQMGDYEASQAAYEELVALTSDNATYYLHLADAYQADHRVGVAERALDKAIKLKPDYIEAYLMRGALSLRGASYSSATADAQAVIELNPDDGRGYALLGEVQLAQREWWDATETFTLALNAGDTRAEVYEGRGWAWHQLRYMPYAVRDYEKAVTLGENDPMLLYHFGLALLDVGRYGDALDPLVGAMNAGIDTPEAYAVLAVALDANRRRTEAEDAYRRAIELDARYSDVEFLRDQPLWSQASINRARTILARLDAS